VTLVCGAFSELKDRAPETGVDVYYYAPKGRDRGHATQPRRTPEMIDFFSRRIGVPYPHRRYSQVFVHDFIFGGMENTTAATLTSEAMLDQRAALDHDVESLVCHELAHQWWGDLLTCREWPEAWLNEGFATYFEYVWREHTRGRDEADVDLLGDLDAYLGEAGTYQRPISAASTRSPSTFSIGTCTKRAVACCTCCATSWARTTSGAPCVCIASATRAARSKRAIWCAPSRKRPVAT